MLTIACLLSSCAGGMASQQPESSPSTAAPTPEMSIDSLFVEGGSASKDWKNSQGYSGTVTVTTWVGVQGNDSAITHPHDSRIIIPAAKNTVCIVPFLLTVSNTTESADFATDIQCRLFSSVQPAGNSKMATEGVFIYRNGAWVHPDYWSYKNDVSSLWRDTKQGFNGQIAGYIAVNSYYSPEHPNGNESKVNRGAFAGLKASTMNAEITLKMRASGNGIELYEDIPAER